MGRQRGGSLLALCMLLLLLGLLALGAMNRQLFFALRFNQQEKAFLVAYNQASSALGWGLRHHWLSQIGWQCQEVAEEFRSCLYYAEQADNALLVGQSKQLAGIAPVRLYRLLTVSRQEGGEKVTFTLHKQGWLDFCPLREEVQCTLP